MRPAHATTPTALCGNCARDLFPRSAASLILLSLFVLVASGSNAPGCIERVSVADDGTQATGNESELSSISANSRFVAFDSGANNLVRGDTNDSFDIFLRDRCFGIPATTCSPTTTRVSVATDGTQGNSDSLTPSLSSDGRFVAFESFADNLVQGDTNGAVDIFVRDTCKGAKSRCKPSTVRVSVSTDGIQGDSDSRVPSVSADGRFIAFESFASNLVPEDHNGTFDVFVRDTCARVLAGCTPSTARVSLAADGAEGNKGSEAPSISGDGRFVAFESNAGNLVRNDTNEAGDIFLRDTCAGVSGSCVPSTVRLSVATRGAQADNGSVEPAISENGRFAVFVSFATNLVPSDTNNKFDVFMHDTCITAPSTCRPSTIRVSVATDGAQGSGDFSEIGVSPAISAGGRFVAFASGAEDLVPDDTNGVFDIFVRDTCAGVLHCQPSTRRISVSPDGSQADRGSQRPSIGSNGAMVIFQSFATNLVMDDTNGLADIFLVSDSCR